MMVKVLECFLLQKNIGTRFEETRCCKKMDKYDYIIAGAGCAGLSLLHYINQDSSLHQKKILVIDDLADREHFCDILIDQNLGTRIEDYKNLVII